MTFNKMRRVLDYLGERGLHGEVVVTAGNELALEPSSQPEQAVHNQLRLWGFIHYDNGYIYRPPPPRKRKAIKN
jgi:hypothetical protein